MLSLLAMEQLCRLRDTCILLQFYCCDAGENAIVIVAGANNKLSVADVHEASEIIRRASVTVFQFETPIETTIEALKIAKQGEGL